MTMTAQQTSHTLASVAEALGGRVIGDGALSVRAVVHPLDARAPDDLALAIESTEAGMLAKSTARMAVVAKEVPGALAGQIVVTNTRMTIPILTRLFDKPVHAWQGVHPSAVIDPTARLGKNVSIGPMVYVGPGASVGDGTVVLDQVTIGADATVGKDCLFHPGVRVGERVRIGDRVILHMNAVIGSDGFSYVTPEISSIETAKASGQVSAFNLKLERINSIGTVSIEDDVEIGACSTIDRSTVATTVIGRGTKIDNQVTVAHNSQMGAGCLVAGQTGIAGSVTIGRGVVMGGQVGIADHVTIGDGAILTAGAGIPGDVAPRSIMYGNPAMPRDQFGERYLNLGRLTRFYKKVAELEDRITKLEND